MFKLVAITVLALTLQSVSAHPQGASSVAPPIAILSQTQTEDGTGNFNYAFESADGVKEEASGSLKNIKVPKLDEAGQVVGEQDGQGITQTGKYSYTAPDGQLIEVTWTADENGFQPIGAHIPQAL